MSLVVFSFIFDVLPVIYVVISFAFLGIGLVLAFNLAVNALLTHSPAIPRAVASFHHRRT